jgi:predicted glutamine amidotransferase
MCIAICKPKNITLPQDHAEESYCSNGDGAGFAVARGGRIILQKGFFSLKAFTKAFEPFRNDAALVHFRIATSGGINKEMCHPFLLCNGKYALIHNGVLSIAHDKQKESDTSRFCSSVLTPLLDAGVSLHSPALRYLVEEAIGSYNKIAVMDSAGNTVIFNEKSGNEVGGIWYSNTSYLPYIAPFKTVRDKKTWLKESQELLKAEDTNYPAEAECWYCGDRFTQNTAEDVLCTQCEKEEEVQYFNSEYNRR